MVPASCEPFDHDLKEKLRIRSCGDPGFAAHGRTWADAPAAERSRIQAAVRTLRDDGDDYWAYTTEALGKAVDAWIVYERGETERALALMSEAADLEDSMEKHPITPGEVLPVRELYGDMLLREGRTDEAIAAYEASLERTPNRRYAQAGIERARAAR